MTSISFSTMLTQYICVKKTIYIFDNNYLENYRNNKWYMI